MIDKQVLSFTQHLQKRGLLIASLSKKPTAKSGLK
jgi:hypothetical protein